MITDKAVGKAIREAKDATKSIRRCYERGLYLLAHPDGRAQWRFKYVFEGHEKLLSLGAYPEVSLQQAREKRDAERKLVANGKDPSGERRAVRAAVMDRNANSFEVVAREWYAKECPGWRPSHSTRVLALLERDIFKFIGSRPIATLTPPEILTTLRRIEKRGAVDTAHRALQNCSSIFKYAIITRRATSNPCWGLSGALSAVQGEHFPAITEPRRLGELLRAIGGYVGQPSTAYALKLLPLLFVRPGELRNAEWGEFDLETEYPVWRIPAERMKMGDAHLVPLSRQAVELLKDLRPISNGRLLFPSLRTGARPISDNTINAALRRLGFDGNEHVGHGFRSTASTMLNELGWNPDSIELQLAHRSPSVRAIYNRGARLEERRKMMQAWADHIDSMRRGDDNKVVPIKKRASA